MNKLIEWFARNGVAANLLMVAIVGAGVYSGLSKIVLQEFPDYPSRTITIAIDYRGATPTEIEEAIVTRVEEAVYDLEGLKEMESRATSNSGTVSLTIDDNFDLGMALDEVKNRVDTIRNFPEEAERPRISIDNFEERVITVVLAGDLSEGELKRLGEEIRDEITNLPSVSLATLKAVRPYEISVEVSESALREYGLTFDTVVRAIRSHSIDLSAGSIKTEGGNIMLRTSQQAYTQREFESVVVITRPDGTRITLKDIATVNDGFDETPIRANFNGQRAIAVDVFRTGGQSAIELGESVKAYIEQKQEELPAGIEITYWQDDSERIKGRLQTLRDSALMGFFLVLIVLSLFLRPSLAIWVALGIPIAFAGTFWLLALWGVSLNLITLFAFILVLGIVVDDAIVTGENVYQHMQAGEPSLSASIKGTQEVAIPVIFGVLTTMVAFYPLTVMTGFRGNFFKQIPIVIIPVLFFSLIESKLILPAHLKHCRGLLKKAGDRNYLMRFQRFFADGLERFVIKVYRPCLDLFLEFRYATAAVFIAFLGIWIAALMTGHVNFTSFPRIPRDQVQVTLVMPAGTTFEQTEAHIRSIEAAALDMKREMNERHGVEVIKHVFATAGGRPFGGGFRGGGASGVAEQGEVVVELATSEEGNAAVSSREVTMELRRRSPNIPEAEQLNFSFSRGSSGRVSVQVMGPRIEDLTAISREVQKHLATYEGLYDIEDSFERATEELELELKPLAAHLGVTAQNLASQVRQAFFGAEAQRIQRGRDDVRVMVRYPEEERRSLAALQTMMIRTQSGLEVPFEEVAQVVPGKALPSIQRIDRNRIIRISGEGDPEEVDLDGIQAELIDLVLPKIVAPYSGVSYSLEGRAAESRDNNAEMVRGVYFVLAVIYVLLAIPFRSYFQPFIVMSAIPFGVIGAIMGHQIMSFLYGVIGAENDPASSITMLSLLGMLALSGVVVNDSLVMVDFINRKTKQEGMPLGEAVRLAGAKRFRPILLTSLTTFMGLMPLMFEDSRQAQFLIPMAISLGWGVVFATFITLVLVPVITLIFEDIRLFFCWLYDRPAYGERAAAPSESAAAGVVERR